MPWRLAPASLLGPPTLSVAGAHGSSPQLGDFWAPGATLVVGAAPIPQVNFLYIYRTLDFRIMAVNLCYELRINLRVLLSVFLR